MTIRRTLILSVLGLIALAGLVIGVVSTIALNGFLLDRLDSQVQEASDRTVFSLTTQAQPTGPQPGISLGQASGTVVAVVSAGVATNGYVLDDAGQLQQLTTAQLAALDDVQGSAQTVGVPADGVTVASPDPVSVTIDGLGAYRVEGRTVTSAGDIVVTGLPLADVNGTVSQLVIVIVLVTAGAMALAGVAGLLLIRFALRPLDRVTATATRVAELPLDRGDVALAERVPSSDTDPRSEVGRVGLAFNRMLEHVASALTSRQRSENKVRQFVADASHELRTPLASIRGYAELTRRTAPELPDEVEHSLGRIESEATRMTTLVEDLLLLARLDAKPELDLTEVDLSIVLVDAVSDAHVAGPDHVWDLDLPEEPVLVAGDAHRLHQVFTNLLANARVHTPAGTTVRVRVTEDAREEASVALVTVADDGPGIAPELLPTLFERFVRGDASRSRHAGSTGLGLAIVEAVVDAHGGSVSVRSKPGETVFTVAIPIQATPTVETSPG
ncbi:sensor histidine kinase [Herbiconiux ginsengi]|uniref:histidine kinase n=1 Tax=Herbiconiux ginsengi TaxID=381665 RepID=A0A1H3TMA8_9MICO|nr:HAMP domain-containing sensor histidine kinase [Herbiconiux ginsengi]SDZ50469.1 two-component system, OmpR family, sensor kinase [Herbiconiux ginsengi]